MKVGIYSIFDSSAQAFNSPVYFPNDGMAIRAFSDTVNGDNSIIAEHPEDFTLFKLGEFNDKDATFDLFATVERISVGVAVLNGDKAIYSRSDLDNVVETVNSLQKRLGTGGSLSDLLITLNTSIECFNEKVSKLDV